MTGRDLTMLKTRRDRGSTQCPPPDRSRISLTRPHRLSSSSTSTIKSTAADTTPQWPRHTAPVRGIQGCVPIAAA